MADRKIWISALAVGASVAGGARAEDVFVYNWSDYFGETTIADHEAKSGDKVIYDRYDSLETMETKMLAGSTGYDWVMTPADQGSRLIAAGALEKLDKTKLANLGNLDPALVGMLRSYDPDLEYLLPYAWGTSGLVFNRAALIERMPDAPLDSYDLIFNPEVVARFADCGVAIIDAPTEVVSIALNYLGLDPGSQASEDMATVAEMLTKIRPSVTHLNTGMIVNDLASGQICLALGWNADAAAASAMAAEAGLATSIEYVVPKEGTVIWFDTMAIPSGAPNPAGAHRFIDHLLDDQVAANLTNFTYYASGNLGARALVDPDILADPAVYPPAELIEKLFLPPIVTDPAAERRRTDLWSAFRTGQ